MKHGWFAVVVLACGGGKVPAPAPVSNDSGSAAPLVTEPTCADMGALLVRGVLQETQGDVDQKVIIATCQAQAWTRAVLDCVGNAAEDDAHACLERLPPAQRAELIAKFPPGERAGDEAGEGDGADGLVDADAGYYCTDVLTPERVATWAPAPAKDPLRVAGPLRLPRISEACETGWGEPVLRCLADADDDKPEPCLGLLEAAQAKALRDAIVDADTARARMTKLAAKPASITCAKVALAHYTDAKWTKVRPSDTAAARKKELGALRAGMTSSCTADKWPPAMRACLVDSDGDECFALGGESPSSWGVVASLAKPPPSGVAECDQYIDLVWKMGSCDKLPLASRTAMKQALVQATGAWANLPADARVAIREACRAATDATQQSMGAAGC